MPISGLVVTFASAVSDHADALVALAAIPEVDIGESSGSKLAIVLDSESRQRDQEIWDQVQGLPGVLSIAVAMIAFDEQGGNASDAREIPKTKRGAQ